jgi:hypothetical protein
MKREIAWLISLLTVLVVGVVIGCGGSGGGGGSTSSGSSIFLQDDMNVGYSHVWVTIDSVSLVKNGVAKTVFDDTSAGGKVVDLSSMHDANGALFLLLGQAPPAGPFQSATVTVASTLSVVPTGTNVAVDATFQGATGPTFAMSLNLGNSNAAPLPSALLIDFNLKNWTLNGTVVSAPNNAFLSAGIWAGFATPGRILSDDYLGKVSSLTGTAPNQTFTLSGPTQVAVQTSSSTVIFNADGTPNASLSTAESAGDFAVVTGSFDAMAKVIDATSIKLVAPTDNTLAPGVGGIVQSDDATAGTIVIQVANVDNWMPTTQTLTINVGSSTSLIDGAGVSDTSSQFFTALTPGTTKIFASGAISNGVMTAGSVRIVNPSSSSGTGGGKGGEAAFMGSVSNVNASEGTFDLQISAWEGLWAGSLTTIHVTTNSSTVFGPGESETAFFEGLKSTTSVVIRGAVNEASGTMVASSVSTGTKL